MKSVVWRMLKIAPWVVLVVLISFPIWLIPFRAMRLRNLARSVTQVEVEQLIRQADVLRERGVPDSVIMVPRSHPKQRGIVRFRDGGYVRFAFCSHPGLAVFEGGGYRRTVKSEGWCCELMLPEIDDLDALDRCLDAMETE